MTSPGSTAINISNPFAAVYWGFVVSLILGGITVVQAYIYFSTSKDNVLLRWTAFSIIVFDLASSALIAQSIYYYLVPNFGALSPLSSVTAEVSAECLISTLITFNSQMYFAYQLHSVKRFGTTRWIVVGTIAACTAMALAGGVACVVAMFIFRDGVLAHRSNVFAIGFGLAKGFGALADILATIAMCIFLASAKTGVSETNTLLNKLRKFVIQRGALVTLAQTLLLITFYAMPNHLYWVAFHFNVTKLYANTFFAMLNGRQHLRENITYSKMSKTFVNSSSHSTRDTIHPFSHEGCDLHIESQQDRTKSFNMPTITRTVVIADM